MAQGPRGEHAFVRVVGGLLAESLYRGAQHARQARKQFIEIAGGENIFTDVPYSAFETTNAEIVTRNPDVIMTPLWPKAGPYEVTTVSEIVMREGYHTITAVMNDRVYHYDSSLLKRPGPRQVIAIRKLAYLLHPYYFKNPENSVSPWELGKIDAYYDPPAPLP